MDSEDRSLALGIVRWLPASSLSQIHVACSTMKMSSFPLEIKKNIQATKSYRFYSSGEPRARSNKSSTAPRLSLRTGQPTSLVFFSFLVESHRDRGIEWRGILYPAYPAYPLQQHIFLAFCNDFDAHYRMLSYILLRNTTLLFPKWRQKSPLFLGREHGNLQNYKLWKFVEN